MELSSLPLNWRHQLLFLLPVLSPTPTIPQVVEEAKSVSEALGVPLYRAGDTVPRPPPPRVPREEEGSELLASVGPIRAACAKRKPKVYTCVGFERELHICKRFRLIAAGSCKRVVMYSVVLAEG